MIADVTFLNVPYAYSSRQIPIGDLSEYEMHTVSNVKCSEDLVQSIAVPSFDNYSKANMVVINTEYYWISGYRTKTYQEEVVIFDIVYNAVSSHLLPGSVLKGVFERTPTDVGELVSPIAIQSDSLEVSRTIKLPRLPFYTAGAANTSVYMYTITTIEDSKMNLYMGFSNGFNGSMYKSLTGVGETLAFEMYPAINEVINDIDTVVGIPADTVVCINISERCPWNITIEENRPVITVNFDNDTNTLYKKAAMSSPVNPNIFRVLHRIPCVIKVSPQTDITLTSKECHCGNISITDSGYNKVASFSPYSKTMKYWVNTGIDYYGVFTQICFGSTKGKNGIVTFNEGKLPWVGDSWENYVTRSLDADRRELNSNINNARDQRNIDLAEGAANAITTGVIGAVATGNPLGAVAGIAQFAGAAISAEAKGRLSDRKSKEDLAIQQMRIKDSVSNFFNTDTGVGYILSCNRFEGAAILITTPSMLTDTQFNGYVEQFGYPSTGYKEVTVVDGFIKGMLTETIVPGLKGDLLNEELMKGVRLISGVNPPSTEVNPQLTLTGKGNISGNTDATFITDIQYKRNIWAPTYYGGYISLTGLYKYTTEDNEPIILDINKINVLLGVGNGVTLYTQQPNSRWLISDIKNELNDNTVFDKPRGPFITNQRIYKVSDNIIGLKTDEVVMTQSDFKNKWLWSIKISVQEKREVVQL